MHIYTVQQTAELLPFDALVAALRTAATEYSRGLITSPERMGVPLGTDGVMLSMPAVAADIAIHKLVNVQPGNTARDLPTIHGQGAAFDSTTGQPLFILDGPVVTGRRTAAVSLLGIESLLPTAPKTILIIGTGTQAVYRRYRRWYPSASIGIRSRSEAKAQTFCARHGGAQANLAVCPAQAIPEAVDVVITVTTSRTPVYDEAALAGRLVVAVGASRLAWSRSAGKPSARASCSSTTWLAPDMKRGISSRPASTGMRCAPWSPRCRHGNERIGRSCSRRSAAPPGIWQLVVPRAG